MYNADVFPGLLAPRDSYPKLFPPVSGERETPKIPHGASGAEADASPGSEKFLGSIRHRVHCYGFSRSVPPVDDFKVSVESGGLVCFSSASVPMRLEREPSSGFHFRVRKVYITGADTCRQLQPNSVTRGVTRGPSGLVTSFRWQEDA